MIAHDAATDGRVPWLTRLYVWSVIFEPLLLFVLFEATVTGITGNLSRLLQLLVVVLFGVRLSLILAAKGAAAIKIPRWPRMLTTYFRRYFALAVIAGAIGLASGAYAVTILRPLAPELSSSTFASQLNSEMVRPLFEYIVTLYYFLYFVAVPYRLFTKPADIAYALSRFKLVFVIGFIAGVIDQVVSVFEIFLIPRHFSDWSRIEPTRFHGLAGEPRQAFVYLFFALAMLHLDAHVRGRPLNKWWVVAIIAAALSTQSTSGLIGIALFLAIAVAYTLSLYPQHLYRVTAGVAAVAAVSLIMAVNSPRVMDYARSASGLWTVLENDEALPYLMSKANSDIYPLYDLTRKLRNADMVPVLIGSGFGSASAVTNRYFEDAGAVSNPHSQLARSLYESGLVGTFLFIMVFLHPVRSAVADLPVKRQQVFILLTLLLVGCFLGHRSAAPFIYTGTLVAAFRVKGAVGDQEHPGTPPDAAPVSRTTVPKSPDAGLGHVAAMGSR